MAAKKTTGKARQKTAAKKTTSKRLHTHGGEKTPVTPFAAMGAPGFTHYRGILKNIEKNTKLNGRARYIWASDILGNISSAGAGIRFFMQLVARVEWTVVPAKDIDGEESSDEAIELAKFVQEVMDDMTDSWSRIIRRMAMFRYHGFGFGEWVAKKRDDGRIGFENIYQRPQHTIMRWDIAEDGSIQGVFQTNPQTGREQHIPIKKLIYMVDDTLTDSPEGMGLFRHINDPATRLVEYLKLEGIGLERDLRGIPVGKAPLTLLRQMVKTQDGFTQADADEILSNFQQFLEMQAKDENTSVLLDSQGYKDSTGDGVKNTATPMWSAEIMSANGSGLPDLSKVIDRLHHEVHRLIGTEVLMVGEGPAGTRSLADNKSDSLFLNVDSTTHNMAEQFERDFIGAIWWLNGFPDELKPSYEVEKAEKVSIAEIATIIRDIATSGAPITGEDPIVDFVRDRLGAPHAPEFTGGDIEGLSDEIPIAEPVKPEEAVAENKDKPEGK